MAKGLFKQTYQQAFELGMQTRYILDKSISQMIRPNFQISKTQHNKIMEILKIDHNQSKKMFNSYIITVNKNNNGNK